LLIPSVAVYGCLIYLVPTVGVARLTARFLNTLAGKLLDFPQSVSVLIHLCMIYGVLHFGRTSARTEY
ncbi:MAG: hypothetical protein V3S89_14740, partial [Desulfobacterales bacterium]